MLYTKQTGTNATAKQTYIWSDGQIVYEQTGTDNIGATVYTYGLTRLSAKERTVSSASSPQVVLHFYRYNAHGDVVRLVSTSGVSVKIYEYDAFGNERNATPGDTNPFRYCGEYYDTATQKYFLRARWYDPATGRFTQQDSWAYMGGANGYNRYTYCLGNPISFIDPSGNVIIVTGSNIDMVRIIKIMRLLTDYSLSLNFETGEVSYTKNNSSSQFPVGNELISSLIDSEHIITISVFEDGFAGNATYFDDGDSAYYTKGEGGDSVIEFDLAFEPEIYTLVEGKEYSEPMSRPLYIGLAHELIHSLHYSQGTVIHKSEEGYNNYYIKEKIWFFHKTRMIQEPLIEAEELFTIGLSDYRTSKITENRIRAEHGLQKRTAYFAH